MSRPRFLFALLVLGILLPLTATSQTNVPLSPRATPPKLVPVAETSLLMEGLAQANFRGLEKLLTEKPKNAESWKYARGQSLLIGETGNLLMLRPPKNQGQEDWMTWSAELREAASKLAKQIAAEDLTGSRLALIDVATACNRCHETFRVQTRLTPFRQE